jgi:ankyrin repeat protein
MFQRWHSGQKVGTRPPADDQKLPAKLEDTFPQHILVSADTRLDMISASFNASAFMEACRDTRYSDILTCADEANRLPVYLKARNTYNFGPLHFAAARRAYKIIVRLLWAGADPRDLADGGVTPLHLAACMGYKNIVDIILMGVPLGDAEVILRETQIFCTTHALLELPAHLAVASNTGGLELLLALSPDDTCMDIWKGYRNALGETILHRAAASRNHEAMEWLLEHNNHETYNELARAYVSDKYNRSALWHAAAAGYAVGIRMLANERFACDEPDLRGRTPLHAACREGHGEAVEALLELGADPNKATSSPGLTPCHYAALFGHLKCLRQLISCGADINKGMSGLGSLRPIHLAASQGHSHCVRQLILSGASTDILGSHTFKIRTNPQEDVELIDWRTWDTPISFQEMGQHHGHSVVSEMDPVLIRAAKPTILSKRRQGYGLPPP